MDAALALLQEALEVEAKGGMLLQDGSRRRTPGGVFFTLVRSRVSRKDRAFIWPDTLRPRPEKAVPPVPPFPWADRMQYLGASLAKRGVTTTVKVTLIGRPGRMIQSGDCMITTMQSTKAPDLPKGLPIPPITPTPYLVYIARKQWAKVAEAIKDPDDALIVEGFAAYDPEVKGMAVFTQSVTTKKLQAARRAQVPS